MGQLPDVCCALPCFQSTKVQLEGPVQGPLGQRPLGRNVPAVRQCDVRGSPVTWRGVSLPGSIGEVLVFCLSGSGL